MAKQTPQPPPELRYLCIETILIPGSQNPICIDGMEYTEREYRAILSAMEHLGLHRPEDAFLPKPAD